QSANLCLGAAPDLAGPVVSSNWFDRALGRQAGKATTIQSHRQRGLVPRAMTLFRRLDIGFHRRAGANEVAVSINIVHAVDRRPVFIDPEGAGWKVGGLARIGPGPLADEVFDGVRGVLQSRNGLRKA